MNRRILANEPERLLTGMDSGPKKALETDYFALARHKYVSSITFIMIGDFPEPQLRHNVCSILQATLYH